MSWQQLQLIIPEQHVAEFEDQLLNFGALSITLQDAQDTPIFEPELGSTPVWAQTKLTALFTLEADLRKIANLLQDLHPEQNLTIHIEMLADQDWERVWLRYFKPKKFGNNFWVVPTGYDIPDPKAVNLMLDPGLAFGTGTHPTTAMCLSWLAEHDLTNKTVIDYGCGSGILTVAALLLGTKEVWAIDYDPQALMATKDNAERNQIDFAKLHCGKNADLPRNYQADILVANILANPLINLATTFSQHVKSGGEIVLSGILAQQTDDVLAAYQPYFTLRQPQQQEDWVCLAGNKIT